MVQLGNIRYQIVDSKGKPLPEYAYPEDHDKDEDDGTSVACYVQTPDKHKDPTFRIRISTVEPPTHELSEVYGFSVFYDGNEDLFCWTFPLEERSFSIDAFNATNSKTGQIKGKALLFNPIELTDGWEEDEQLDLIDKDGLGTIEIQMAKITGMHPVRRSKTKKNRRLPIARISEREMKGVSATHFVRAGKTIYDSVRPAFDIECSRLFDRVIFHYRTKEVLQALGVIPEDEERFQNPKERHTKQKRKAEKGVDIIALDDSEPTSPPNTSAMHRKRSLKRGNGRGLKRVRSYDSDESDDEQAPIRKRIQIIDLTAED